MNIRKLPCNHHFCVPCLSLYIKTQITEEGGLLSVIKCPGFQCMFEMEDESVLELLEDPRLKVKYQQIVANGFVQNHRLMKWCPTAKCHNAVLLETGVVSESVRCTCGTWFCFHCHNISHDPVPCDMLKEWAKVKAEDFEAHDWILRHTKPCPGCKINIQKQGGCMHMTCSKCRHEFCWTCMGRWAHHHVCNKLDGAAPPPADGAIYVRRFSTYNVKHEEMKQAYNLDVAQYQHRMVQGAEMEIEKQWIKIDFVASAVEILLQCRRTLMHSYIFSYLMTTIDNQMFIFEDNLKYLEQCTEQLSGILENDVMPSNVLMLKSKIVDGTSLCVKRRCSLMDHINEGYDKGWWRKFPIPHDEMLAADEAVIQELIF